MELATGFETLEYGDVGNFADIRLKKQVQSFTVGLYLSRQFVYGGLQETAQEKCNLAAGWQILK